MNNKMSVKDATDKLIIDPTDQLKRSFEHFEELLQVPVNNQSPTPKSEPSLVKRISCINTEATSLREIEAAIQSMKSNKALWVNRVSYELLKADISYIRKYLRNRNISGQPTQDILTKIPKKGDLTKCDNWRCCCA